MSGSVVNVLTPNGRRQNVKVQPNTAILKVLEEVCEKHKFDPSEYDLKHHKRIVDLTTSFRFSGLPNNAQLEMVEAQKKRQDAEVEIVVQSGDGSRLDGKFKPNITLLNIIEELCADELTGDDLFAIYMRTEVPNNKLGTTSLKDLGLISGRAIIRLVHRDPNAAKIQANVALNLAKPIETKDEETKENRENKMRKTDDIEKCTPSTSQSIINVLKEDKKKHDSTEESKQQQQQQQQQQNEEEHGATSGKLANCSNTEAQQSIQEDEKMVVSSPEPPVVEGEEEMDEDPGEIHILGERNAVLFTQDAAKAANLNDLPDSFFDLNVNDIKLLIKDLRTQAEGIIEQPLMTAKLREMEEDQKQLSVLNKYKTVIIRIQFPNRYVLQGTFTPFEIIETVIDFVRPYLGNPNTDFYLYTTPPKTVLSKESRLFEVNCVPSAILHFGSEDKQPNYLKEDILDKVSSPQASLIQALADRGIKQYSEASKSQSRKESNPSTSQQVHKSAAANFNTSSSTSSDGKLPKWFKPFGK